MGSLAWGKPLSIVTAILAENFVRDLLAALALAFAFAFTVCHHHFSLFAQYAADILPLAMFEA